MVCSREEKLAPAKKSKIGKNTTECRDYRTNAAVVLLKMYEALVWSRWAPKVSNTRLLRPSVRSNWRRLRGWSDGGHENQRAAERRVRQVPAQLRVKAGAKKKLLGRRTT